MRNYLGLHSVKLEKKFTCVGTDTVDKLKKLKAIEIKKEMSLIQVKELGKRFGSNVVLQDVNLDINENEIFGIIGINGSGKTTLLKIIVGFYKPEQGRVFYNNQPLHKMMKQIKHDFGFTTQENSFYPKLTVLENIRYFGSLYGLNKKQIQVNVQRLLSLMDLEDVSNKLAEHLSGGMQRRLDMACSMIHNPKVLILDEPTEDLDPLLRKDIVRLIKKINSLGTTIIITSHILDDIEILCHRIAILHNKKVITMGTIDELRQLYGKKEEIHLETQSANYESIIRNLNITEFLLEEGKLIVYTPDAEKVLHNMLHIIENENDKLLYVDIRKPSLKEVFASITNKKWLEDYSL